ncbi:MAG TPA: hypothetical protein VD971_00325 [Phycisphaerales bacterium]|nr:hypothetical protein [Phycisphaerales bacterium]
MEPAVLQQVALGGAIPLAVGLILFALRWWGSPSEPADRPGLWRDRVVVLAIGVTAAAMHWLITGARARFPSPDASGWLPWVYLLSALVLSWRLRYPTLALGWIGLFLGVAGAIVSARVLLGGSWSRDASLAHLGGAMLFGGVMGWGLVRAARRSALLALGSAALTFGVLAGAAPAVFDNLKSGQGVGVFAAVAGAGAIVALFRRPVLLHPAVVIVMVVGASVTLWQGVTFSQSPWWQRLTIGVLAAAAPVIASLGRAPQPESPDPYPRGRSLLWTGLSFIPLLGILALAGYVMRASSGAEYDY